MNYTLFLGQTKECLQNCITEQRWNYTQPLHHCKLVLLPPPLFFPFQKGTQNEHSFTLLSCRCVVIFVMHANLYKIWSYFLKEENCCVGFWRAAEAGMLAIPRSVWKMYFSITVCLVSYLALLFLPRAQLLWYCTSV